MIVTLIGTSGSGKSYWSRRLEREGGFQRIGCDDLIERHLVAELSAAHKGIAGVAAWMGQPNSQGFEQRQQLYLDCEHKVMEEIISSLKQQSPMNNVVIDTTGSVIYTGDAICNELANLTTVVYLEADNDSLEHLAAQFLKNPKPIVWGSLFSQVASATSNEEKAACYKELIKQRSTSYQKIAKATLPFSFHKNKNVSVNEFLTRIQQGT